MSRPTTSSAPSRAERRQARVAPKTTSSSPLYRCSSRAQAPCSRVFSVTSWAAANERRACVRSAVRRVSTAATPCVVLDASRPDPIGVGARKPASIFRKKGSAAADVQASQPDDVVAKGARRRNGTPGAAAANRLVGPEHLAQDDRERPPVEKGVVEGPDEAATPGCIPDQGEALQGGAREVDAFPPVLREEGRQARFECLCGERPPVVSTARERRLPVDFLAGALGPVPAEGRPEDRSVGR